MPREASEIERRLGRLLTAIQSEEMRAIGSPDWSATHAALGRAESLYCAAKQSLLEAALAGRAVRVYLGNEWLSRHPRVLPAIQDLEHHLRDFAHQD
jgi:hypothetical protein